MASIYDIAKAAGTSIATVSYVLNNSNRVSKATADRVRKAVADLNYQPKASAQALARGRTLTITLVSPMSIYMHQASLYSLINGIGNVLEPTDYRLFIHPTLNRPGSLLELEAAIRSHQMDGVILMHVSSHDPRVTLLRENNMPFVLIGSSEECADVSWVDADVDAAVNAAVDHLIAIRRERIAMIGEHGDANITLRLMEGFRQAIEQRGLYFSPRDYLELPEKPDENDEILKEYLSRPDRPNGVFAVTDLTVLSTYRAASQLNLRIPQDLAVIGYADSPLYPFLAPPCSAVFSSAVELGQISAQLLLANLSGDTTEARHVLLPPRIIPRASTHSSPI